MTNKVKVEPADIDLVKLKNLMRYGDIERIAESSGYSAGYVAQVLNPNMDSKFKADIVVAAVKLVQDKVKIPLDPDIAAAITKNGQNSGRNNPQ